MTLFVLITTLQLAVEAPQPPVPPQPPPSAEEQFELRRVGFDDFAAADFRHGGVHEWTRAYRGKYKEPLAGAEFYAYVGRPDLAVTYDQRFAKKWKLFAGGAALATVGFAAGGYGLYKSSGTKSAFDFGVTSCTDIACHQAAQARADRANADERSGAMPYLIGGFGLAAVGVGLAVWGAVLEPNPVDAPGARRLADEYNKRLRAELGLAPVATGPSDAAASAPAGATWMVAPVMGPDGAGLVVGASF